MADDLETRYAALGGSGPIKSVIMMILGRPAPFYGRSNSVTLAFLWGKGGTVDFF